MQRYLAEDSFDGVADPFITPNPAVAHAGGPQSLPSGQPFVQNSADSLCAETSIERAPEHLAPSHSPAEARIR